jgi:hypothetical protein
VSSPCCLPLCWACHSPVATCVLLLWTPQAKYRSPPRGAVPTTKHMPPAQRVAALLVVLLVVAAAPTPTSAAVSNVVTQCEAGGPICTQLLQACAGGLMCVSVHGMHLSVQSFKHSRPGQPPVPVSLPQPWFQHA